MSWGAKLQAATDRIVALESQLALARKVLAQPYVSKNERLAGLAYVLRVVPAPVLEVTSKGSECPFCTTGCESLAMLQTVT